jgi:predicted O-linked N-acetylglucosamine transferase (SPINDLY family)
LNYVPGLRQADIYAEHREYAKRHCPAGALRKFRNTRDIARKLRVGYVSGDFRKHPVAHFIEPVLARHHRNRVEIFCYYNNPRADDVTTRIRSHAEGWREVFAMADDVLAELILDDAIDVLVDLSGHTGLHRLPVFGRRPAPVQATWLGYLNTTGLDTIDYRITDSHASPEGLFDAYHSERLVRLPDSQWCYRPPSNCPDVCFPPSANGGPFTFAAFSNLAKIGPPVVDLWSRLLMQIPNSRLLVVGPGLGSVRSEFRERFTRCGVPDARVQLEENKPFTDYLAMHREADVMLDTFPYNGGTTTCHALWMGVPVVSLAGDTAPGRGGASVLNVIGLGDLVADTAEKYLGIASNLASDRQRLGALRSGMRERMKKSALMDSERFVCNLEDAYAAMWRSWCEKC